MHSKYIHIYIHRYVHIYPHQKKISGLSIHNFVLVDDDKLTTNCKISLNFAKPPLINSLIPVYLQIIELVTHYCEISKLLNQVHV